MHRILLATAAFALMASAAAAQEFIDFTVAGTNPDGSPYGGQARITLLSDTTCQIDWVSGDTSSTGICMRNGIAFSAAYTLGDAVGLAIYEIKDDGTLDGIWTIAGQPGTGTEVLTPM